MPTLGQVKYKIICYCDSKSIKFVVTVAGTVELGKDVVVAATQVDLITFGLSSRSSRKRKSSVIPMGTNIVSLLKIGHWRARGWTPENTIQIHGNT
ncbi:hypothetical protein SEVIR_9G058500v4 [Setaria viridis]|uniref:Uncharacterized protein n=1 Tax=Setaria viridis TaxID=4556 RepID=A0A4U6SRW9_SETVI|nr:hypothetical protein SEVIR_9G058500v2 [Setaria viridis]TKV90895.1 hypothetical protein SEVIR_9G058500v2 [Setaria viridis]